MWFINLPVHTSQAYQTRAAARSLPWSPQVQHLPGPPGWWQQRGRWQVAGETVYFHCILCIGSLEMLQMVKVCRTQHGEGYDVLWWVFIPMHFFKIQLRCVGPRHFNSANCCSVVFYSSWGWSSVTWAGDQRPRLGDVVSPTLWTFFWNNCSAPPTSRVYILFINEH